MQGSYMDASSITGRSTFLLNNEKIQYSYQKNYGALYSSNEENDQIVFSIDNS